MAYREMKVKLLLEHIGMWPFVQAGKIAGHFWKLNSPHKAFLFFPSADVGGSPQVNADITNCIKHDCRPLIIFSKKPRDNLFLDKFQQEGVRIIDLHKLIDNKLYHFVNFFFRGVISTWINSQQGAFVLGGECIFFYKIIPHINKRIRRVEICHLDTWLNYSIGFIDMIDLRIFSTQKLKENVEAQYRANLLKNHYFDKLLFIENAIDIPPYKVIENKELQVVFIGRGSPQKRVHLVAAIAEGLHKSGFPVHFSFVGDV
jgi:glycosyltransferase involved in cell wall biosynthesis